MHKKITFVTLFPNIFENFKEYSIIKRAIEKSLIEIEVIDFRKYANNKSKRIDDYQFGGGAGMVIGIEPIVNCLNEIKTKKSLTYLMSPSGKTFNQDTAYKLAKSFEHLILICGHYEGFDARIERYIDGEISIGDFIITGGEIASQVVCEAIVRLIDGVISADSLVHESFNDNLLDYPVYTRPASFNGDHVPNVLLSGNHQAIANWRQEQRILLTKQKRIDLYKKYIDKKGNKNDKY